MGSAECCVRRDGCEENDDQYGRARSMTWRSVAEPEEYISFLDCMEEMEDDQWESLNCERIKSDDFKEVLSEKRPHAGSWHCMRLNQVRARSRAGSKNGVSTYVASSSSHDENISDADKYPYLSNLYKTVHDVWAERIKLNSLDAGIASRLEEGFFELHEWTQPDTLKRMLRAMDYNEEEAAKLLVKAIECRVRERELFQSLRCDVLCDMRVIGRDKQLRPVIYMCAKSQRTPLSTIYQQILLAFEAGVFLSQSEIDHTDGQVVFVADMLGLSPRLNADATTLKDLGGMLGSVYADRLNSFLIVDFSILAQACWSIIKPLLSEKTQNKISFVGERKARQIAADKFQERTYARLISAFDIYRDSTSTREDQENHAAHTSICDVPFGSRDVMVRTSSQ